MRGEEEWMSGGRLVEMSFDKNILPFKFQLNVSFSLTPSISKSIRIGTSLTGTWEAALSVFLALYIY